mmetsp:Transcript_22602/g.58131  ORF Transcript_22602/g.58131 Transcript_22602/m.58131 type:complete len:236 (-) Transcript_22602:726-1433(-)
MGALASLARLVSRKWPSSLSSRRGVEAVRYSGAMAERPVNTRSTCSPSSSPASSQLRTQRLFWQVGVWISPCHALTHVQLSICASDPSSVNMWNSPLRFEAITAVSMRARVGPHLQALSPPSLRTRHDRGRACSTTQGKAGFSPPWNWKATSTMPWAHAATSMAVTSISLALLCVFCRLAAMSVVPQNELAADGPAKSDAWRSSSSTRSLGRKMPGPNSAVYDCAHDRLAAALLN